MHSFALVRTINSGNSLRFPLLVLENIAL